MKVLPTRASTAIDDARAARRQRIGRRARAPARRSSARAPAHRDATKRCMRRIERRTDASRAGITLEISVVLSRESVTSRARREATRRIRDASIARAIAIASRAWGSVSSHDPSSNA